MRRVIVVMVFLLSLLQFIDRPKEVVLPRLQLNFLIGIEVLQWKPVARANHSPFPVGAISQSELYFGVL